jgi:dTDP-4-amino-4,6-dideoxygalactose transaminase
VIEANAIPVFADIDLDTFNLDPKAVEAVLTSRTRAIIPVHFAGQVADMRPLLALAKKRKLLILEDAAHAHGATWRNRPAGSIGQIASFSFQSSKNLTSGEGGILTTNDDALAASCRSIQNCGRIPTGVWYEHHVISANYRLGEFQSAILNCQLERLEAQTKTRDRNGRYLAARISKLPGIHPQKRPADCTRHSYHLFMLRIDGQAFGAPRSAVIKALQAEGIPCSPGYGFSLPEQPMFRNKAFGPYLPGFSAKLNYRKVHCPNSDLLCREQCAWLGQNIFLGTRADMGDIADAFEKIHEHAEALSRWAKKSGKGAL